MATYTCIPATTTVPPCPAGSAPATSTIESVEMPEYYISHFGHLAIQDVLVGLGLVISLLIGLAAGRR